MKVCVALFQLQFIMGTPAAAQLIRLAAGRYMPSPGSLLNASCGAATIPSLPSSTCGASTIRLRRAALPVAVVSI